MRPPRPPHNPLAPAARLVARLSVWHAERASAAAQRRAEAGKGSAAAAAAGAGPGPVAEGRLGPEQLPAVQEHPNEQQVEHQEQPAAGLPQPMDAPLPQLQREDGGEPVACGQEAGGTPGEEQQQPRGQVEPQQQEEEGSTASPQAAGSEPPRSSDEPCAGPSAAPAPVAAPGPAAAKQPGSTGPVAAAGGEGPMPAAPGRKAGARAKREKVKDAPAELPPLALEDVLTGRRLLGCVCAGFDLCWTQRRRSAVQWHADRLVELPNPGPSNQGAHACQPVYALAGSRSGDAPAAAALSPKALPCFRASQAQPAGAPLLEFGPSLAPTARPYDPAVLDSLANLTAVCRLPALGKLFMMHLGPLAPPGQEAAMSTGAFRMPFEAGDADRWAPGGWLRGRLVWRSGVRLERCQRSSRAASGLRRGPLPIFPGNSPAM
jgi:hypothetical protein